MITEKIITETIFFESISDFLDVSVRVVAPFAVGSYEHSYKLVAVFCDGECFMDFVNQNNFVEQILDNHKIDRAIVDAQNFLNQEILMDFKQKKYENAKARNISSSYC